MQSVIRQAQRALESLEDGTMTPFDTYTILEELDPVLIYFIIRFVREKYPRTNPASQGVMERLIEITNTYDSIVKKAHDGEKDPVREWFDDAYNLRDYFTKPDELMAMLVEKLES